MAAMAHKIEIIASTCLLTPCKQQFLLDNWNLKQKRGKISSGVNKKLLNQIYISLILHTKFIYDHVRR